MLLDPLLRLNRASVRLAAYIAVVVALFVAGGVWYMTSMPGPRHRGPLPPLQPWDLQLVSNLRGHVAMVAAGEHNVVFSESLERTARYIETTLASLGYVVTRQEFEAGGVKVRNIEVSVSSPGADRPHLIVVGAHYDSARGAAGADDNGSGVAALLEIARKLKSFYPVEGVEIRLVFYVNEELPWHGTEKMGSYVHASGLKRDGRDVIAMLSLETIGWYSEARGSQHYPFPYSLFYPSTGDFIAFVGNLRSRKLLRFVVGSFRRHEPFPSEGAVGFESTPGISRSDQWAYWKFGWPAVMVTDTALYRYPYYHTLQDSPDKLDYQKLARVVRGLEGVVRELASPEPKD